MMMARRGWMDGWSVQRVVDRNKSSRTGRRKLIVDMTSNSINSSSDGQWPWCLQQAVVAVDKHRQLGIWEIKPCTCVLVSTRHEWEARATKEKVILPSETCAMVLCKVRCEVRDFVTKILGSENSKSMDLVSQINDQKPQHRHISQQLQKLTSLLHFCKIHEHRLPTDHRAEHWTNMVHKKIDGRGWYIQEGEVVICRQKILS